ncbi:MAG: FkbM family methyltransferase [Thaumarchaeota archaeon]|nr:FkbM family methyltransferase [Nitrososphaerota archaeon]
MFQSRLSNGDRMYLRSAFDFDASTLEEVFYNNIYEKEFTVKPGDVVLDVGAHIGSFTLKAAREVGPAGRVISFEPSSENFGLLGRNVAANSYANIRLYNVAVGSQPGTARLQLHQRRGTNSLYAHSTSESVGMEDVEVRTLDSVVRELNLARVDFMKIDVEGAELEVLKGAKEVLASFHPSIAMETHDFGPSEAELTEFLVAFGYAAKRVPYQTRLLGLLYAKQAMTS